MTRCTSRRRRAETGLSASTATNSTNTVRRKMDQSQSPLKVAPHNPSPTPESAGSDEEILRLRARVAELQRERDHLVAVVDILQEVSSSIDFTESLQAIARKLGDAFGL